MSSIMGGSKQKSSSTSNSHNQAYGTLNDAFSPLLGYASEGASGLSALLGGDTSGLDNYRNATGFNQQMSTGLQNVTNAGAAKGLLRSGATSKGLVDYGEQLSQQSGGGYMDRLLGLAGLGNTAGNILSGAGQVSESNSTSSGKQKKGLGGILGAGASLAAASDRRLKVDIKKVGEFEDGLGKYEYAYKWAPEERIVGVMADEVAELRPWALGPKVGDYATVLYGEL